MKEQIVSSRSEFEEVKLKSEKNILSYQWLNEKDSEIRELYEMLKKGDYISAEKGDFLDVFKKRPTNDLKPVIWKSDNASELLYFILRLMETSLIHEEKRMSYERLKKCFVKTGRKEFTEEFKNLKSGLGTNFSEFKKSSIDAIIKELS